MKTRTNAERYVRKPPMQEMATPPPTATRRTNLSPNEAETAMLTDDFPFLLPRRVDADLAAKLRILARDMERIAAGIAPTARELHGAPVLSAWRYVLTPAGLRLVGRVSGHPRLGDTNAMTSQIWAADREGTWVRTLSRFYRLAEPFRSGAADTAGDFAGGV